MRRSRVHTPGVCRAAAAAACALALATGCTTAPFPVASGTVSPMPQQAGLLQPGDQVDIKFYYAPEINDVQTIRPDGNISLQLVGDVKAAGLTPSGLEKRLEEQYKGLIERTEATVVVRELHPSMVYVGGAVQRPRAVALTGSMTALAAIIDAGGVDFETGTLENVIVLREQDGRYVGHCLRLDRLLAGEDLSAFYLRPGDIIHVQRTGIADANRWIEQHINRMMPGLGVTVLRQTGNMTYGIDMSD